MSAAADQNLSPEPAQPKLVCGLVMPISACDGCSESHWAEVHEILTETVEAAGFEANLVSNADDVGIIQKTIIQNLYNNPIVVCDVSGKNPNVMFELGVRLAFDKPTIIVKDDKTTYSFDTSPIEHLGYPRDLRFSRILEFKDKLSEKIRATHLKATADRSYTTFLKHFGEFTVAKLDKKEVSGQEFILEELKNLRQSMRRLERAQIVDRRKNSTGNIDLCLRGRSNEEIDEASDLVASHPRVRAVTIVRHGDHAHLVVDASGDTGQVKRSLESTLKLEPRRPAGRNSDSRVDAN